MQQDRRWGKCRGGGCNCLLQLAVDKITNQEADYAHHSTITFPPPQFQTFPPPYQGHKLNLSNYMSLIELPVHIFGNILTGMYLQIVSYKFRNYFEDVQPMIFVALRYMYAFISMTSLFAHIVAQPTKWRFSPKNLNQLVIFVIGLAFT